MCVGKIGTPWVGPVRQGGQSAGAAHPIRCSGSPLHCAKASLLKEILTKLDKILAVIYMYITANVYFNNTVCDYRQVTRYIV